MTESSNIQNDGADLRELIKIILKYKWLIIGVTFLVAISAFLTSVLVISPKYEASSYVTLTEPIISAEFDSSIQVSLNMPDTQALVDFAEAEAVIKQVIVELGLESLFAENESKMEATLQGKSQLQLLVSTSDSKTAAQIANTWAEIMVQRLNNLYGTGEGALASIQIEVDIAREKWHSAQNALEDYIPQSRVVVLEVQLEETKNALSMYMNIIELNRILISDTQGLQSQIAKLNPDESLATGDVLSMIALQQRASGDLSGIQFQIQVNEILGQEYTVAIGRAVLQELISAIEEQNTTFREELLPLESRIAEQSFALESERFKVEQLTQERDLSQNAYIALASQLEETRIRQAQDENPAQIGVWAVESQKPSGPQGRIIYLLAIMMGLIFSLVSIFFIEWWKMSDVAENHGQ